MAYDMTDFRTDVVEASRTVPVVIDFWAAWCGPCRTLGPILEKLATESRGAWKLVKIDTEAHPQIAAQFGIRSIPAVKMVYQGAITAEFTGALPEAQVRQWLQQHLPAPPEVVDLEADIAAAEAEGDRDTARRLMVEALQAKPDDGLLRARLAMTFLPEDLTQAREILASVPSESRYDPFREAVDTVARLKGLPHQTGNYLAGRDLYFGGEYAAAAEAWLAVMATDRALDDDGARKALVALFTTLGDRHPVSAKYRRRFGMLLY